MKYKVVYYIESEDFGGAEQILLTLLRAIDREKWEPVLIYHPNPGIVPLIDKISELKIETLPAPAIMNWSDFSGIRNLVKRLKAIHPAVFHAHLISNLRCSSGIICAYLAGIKAIVATQHSYHEIHARRKYKVYILGMYQKLISMLVDCYIAVSYGQAEHLKKAVISQNKVKVVHNGIFVEDFSNHNNSRLTRSQFTNNEEMPIVLTVARLDKLKGHTYLLKAASMVPEAVFLLVGDGPERMNIENQAQELNIADRVIFLGHRDDIPDLLNACDLFVLPSLLEGLPLTILEAMSACRPVIASDIEGINEIIVAGRTGFLVPPADPAALAEKINLVLSDPALAQNVAVAGRERVSREFSAEKMVHGVTKVYEQILVQKMDKAPTNNRTEEQSNLLMRRVDWRFLLDDPHPEKSICFSNGLITEALKTISDTTIASDGHYRHGEYDLAVAVNPNQAILNAAYSALKPGGICYLEWDVNLLFTTKSLRGKLDSIGFDYIQFYLPKPAPADSSTQIWIPLESTVAVNYLIDHSIKETGKGILRRAGRALRHVLWLIIPNLMISAPSLLGSGLKKYTISTIAHKPSHDDVKEPGKPQGNKSAPRYIINNIHRQLTNTAGGTGTDNIFVLMLTKGNVVQNKIVFIVYQEQEITPLAVIKLARVESSISPLLNEINILQKLEEDFGEMKGIPRILFCNTDSDNFAAGQTFLNGIPISKVLKKENFRDVALNVTSWLVQLANKSKNTPRDNWLDTQLESVISAFISNYGAIINPQQIQRFQELIKSLKLAYSVCEHRDTGPWNVLINSRQEIGVVDWESSQYYGLPGRDLVYFMVYLSLLLDGNWEPSDFRRCYRDILDRSSFTGAIFSECLNYYFTELGLPHSLMRPIRLMTWVVHSLERFRRWSDSPTVTQDPNVLRDSLFFILWEEELKDSEENKY